MQYIEFYSVSQSNEVQNYLRLSASICVPFGKQATIITACTSLEWEWL